MKHWAQNGLKALTSAWVWALLATVAWSQSLTWLGTLGGYWSVALGVSADGAVVVGGATNAAGQWRAFRWTASGGMQDLGTLGGVWSEARGVSADGAVVVGWSYNAAGREHAFRWTASGGMEDLGTLPGYDRSYASGVSADGAVVVGWSYNAAGRVRAFRWQNGVMQDLGTQTGGDGSVALGVSANGAVVVGRTYYYDDTEGGYYERAFRWTENDGMQDLGTLGGGWSGASGVSADGAVVVGFSDGRAFRWTASGMEDLNITYASLLTNGSVLRSASAISPDGRYIVGAGYNAATGRPEAYLLDTRCTAHNGDVDANGCVDDADLLAVLSAFGNTGSNLGRVDVNCDQTVDDADLLQVLFNFGSGC